MGPADNLSIDCSVLVVVVGVDEERDREVRRIFWQNPFVRVAVKPEWCKDLLFFWHCHTTSHSNNPHPVNRARRWYTVDAFLNDLCYWPCII